MIQPKYISILKMVIVQAFALLLLLELTNSTWQIMFIDCLETIQETPYSEGEMFLNFPECYNRNGEHLGYWKLQPMNILIPVLLLFFIHIILSIISAVRIGYKWYWSFLSIGFYMILIRVIDYFIDRTSFFIKFY